MTGGGAWAPERRLLTAGLIGLVTAGAFEGMAVPTVLPAMVADLGGLDLYGWAFSAFWLTNIMGITLAGSDVDQRGPGRALVVGVVLFAGGLLVSGLAANMPMVIVGRAIQGSGSGAIGSVVYAGIARAYPPSVTPRMIALVSSAWVVPGLVGPALAGAVADGIGWRWVFLGIVPALVLMGAAVYPQLHPLRSAARAEHPAPSDRRRAYDAARLAVGSTILLASLGVPSLPLAIGLGAVGGLLVVTALRQLLPSGSLRLARGRPSVFAAVFAVAFAFFGTEAFVPLTVVNVRDGSVTLGGLALSAAAVTWAAGSWVQARAASGGTRRALVVAGSGLIGIGIAVTTLVILPQMPVLLAAVGWAIAGMGMGLAYSTLALLMLETAPDGQEGVSSASLQLMFTLGTAFGAGIGGAVVAAADAGILPLPPALGIVNALMVLVAGVALLISLRVPARGAQRHTAAAPALAVPLEHP